MSVLDTIKGTIFSVPKDIASGIKALTSRSPDKEEDTPNFTGSQSVNLDAGGELLNKFQDAWSEIHQASEENAKRAKNVDAQVTELFIYLERQNDAVNQFLLEISSLPQIVADLQNVTRKIESLEAKFEAVEDGLMELENICEEQELSRNKRHHEYQLETYRQRSGAQLEQAKLQMSRNHADKVQKYERYLQRTLHDRQQQFEATFRNEVQYYKKYGTTSPSMKKNTSNSATTQSGKLENFIPDEDENALDMFLASSDSTNKDSKTDPEPENLKTDAKDLTKEFDESKHSDEQPNDDSCQATDSLSHDITVADSSAETCPDVTQADSSLDESKEENDTKNVNEPDQT